MSDFDEKYPEHKKLMKVSDKSQAIGEFLEFGGYFLAEYDDEGEELVPVSKTISTILAEHFGIDEQKIEVEKRAMLEAMREMNP